ncbi:MAG: hypothetical protein AAF215_05345 [Cyanobacteria bacterium P01_A01_bin.123]
MSTQLVEYLTPADQVKKELEQSLGRRLTKSTLQRWRKLIGVALVYDQGRWCYTAKDLFKMHWIGRQLQQERDMTKARVSLFLYLSENDDAFNR